MKVSRLITHVHRLSRCGEQVAWFFRDLEPLREKTRAYLFQLPPSFSPQPELLESFLALLPRETPHLLTAPLVYVRLHGTAGRYCGGYTEPALRQWADRLRSWADQGHEVLVFFNNDVGGHAIRNALTLRGYAGR